MMKESLSAESVLAVDVGYIIEGVFVMDSSREHLRIDIVISRDLVVLQYCLC